MTYPVRATATELKVVRPAESPPTALAPRTEPIPPGSQPIRVGAKVLASRLIHRVDPVYPEEAKRKRIQGSVLLEVLVNEQGEVAKSIVLRGDSLLAQAAVDAVRQWRYQPFLLDNKPIAVIGTVLVTFVLR